MLGKLKQEPKTEWTLKQFIARSFYALALSDFFLIHFRKEVDIDSQQLGTGRRNFYYQAPQHFIAIILF